MFHSAKLATCLRRGDAVPAGFRLIRDTVWWYQRDVDFIKPLLELFDVDGTPLTDCGIQLGPAAVAAFKLEVGQRPFAVPRQTGR
jgi:hypothetical protein